MRKLLPLKKILCAGAVAGSLFSGLALPNAAEARVKLITLPVRERVEIQLDNASATLVEEERIVPLVKGENQVDFSWANTQIDPNTIVFRVVAPVGERMLDVKVLSVSYPPNEAALIWTVGSSDSGSARVRISYLLGNLAKSYKGRPVLRDVSLELRRGEVAALLGPNGAGKTTCFYAIAGLVPPDRGTITVDGQDVTWLPMYRRAKLGIGYLPQEASIFRGLTVADNIRAILEITVKDDEKRHEMLDELMGEFSITHLRRAPAISLSGGERRRVEIARCLAAQPSYVLLDEPFAGVDPLAVADIRSLVRHLKDRGIGVLITDHNVRETLGICDRAYILNAGSVLAQGSPEAVLANPDVRRVYLGESFRL